MMNSTDFSIAFLESLTADMRAVEQSQRQVTAKRSPVVGAITLVSGLISLLCLRGM